MSEEAKNNLATPAILYCRLCLAGLQQSNFKGAFFAINPAESMVGIIKDLAYVNILEGDEYSKLSCITCWNMLFKINHFKNTIQLSDTTLKSQLVKERRLLNASNKLESENGGVIIEDEKHFNVSLECEEDSDDEKINIDEIDLTVVKQEMNSTNEEIGEELAVKTKEAKNIGVKRLYERRKFKCNICDQVFGKSYSLKVHFKKHSRRRCEICSRSFKNNFQFYNHKRTHKEPKHLKCPTCDRICKEELGFKRHLKTHSKVEIQPKIQCEKDNINSESIDLKESTTDLKEPKEMKIETETKRRVTRLHLTQKSNSNTITQKEHKYKCKICTESFEIRKNFLAHYISVHKPYKGLCDVCGKEVANIKHHSAFHIKPFKCNLCNRSYAKKCKLIAHLNKHADRKVQCDICEKILASEQTLYYHKIAIHGDKKRFKCEQCGKEFHFKQSLKGHLRSHLKAIQ